MSAVVIRDELPKLVAYPVGELFLRTHLGSVLPEDRTAIYFLYLSGVQVNHYDPVLSRAQEYPVLALDRRPPQLCADALARLEGKRRGNQIVDERLRGLMRADAQLRGEDPLLGMPELAGEEPESLLSIVIFPVKTRLRRKVEDGILDDALRPMRNWLAAPAGQHATQRPLVLHFDEESGKVSARFAEPVCGAKERYYR